MVCLWRSEDKTVESFLSFHLYTGSRFWTQVTRIVWQGSLPAEPSDHSFSEKVLYNLYLIFISFKQFSCIYSSFVHLHLENVYSTHLATWQWIYLLFWCLIFELLCIADINLSDEYLWKIFLPLCWPCNSPHPTILCFVWRCCCCLVSFSDFVLSS